MTQGDATLTPQPDQSTPRSERFTRSYIACERCRRRKVKCIVQEKPPCAKCKRELRTCVFRQCRTSGRQREPPSWAASADHQLDENMSPPPQTSPPAVDLESLENLTSADLPMDNNLAHARTQQSLVERAVPFAMLNSGESPIFSSEARQAAESLMSRATPLPGLAPAPDPHPAGNVEQGSVVPTVVNELCEASPELLSTWNKCRFVRQHWLTAQAAITYVELFRRHIVPFTPVRVGDYCIPANHQRLIQHEPMMCCTILMISSRYFTLSVSGGLLRGQMLHQRLWEYCELLIRRILYGLEKTSTSRIRIVSTIESFLLISDWHPRSILFPLDHEMYDSDPEPLDTQGIREAERSSGPSVEWRNNVLEPARRSDRMSLMMLGTATNLAYELGLFADDLGMITDGEHERRRRMRTRKLLYIYVTNIAVRMGFPSGLPQDIVFASSKESFNALNEAGTPFESWNTIADLWLELVRLSKNATAIFFGSHSHTRKQLLNGQYVTLIQHILPLLDQWYIKFQSSIVPGTEFQALCDLLSIEYQTLRSFIHALSMQAVVERASARGIEMYSQNDLQSTCFLSQDINFIHEVIVSSQEILRSATSMASSGVLRLMPVRQTLSIISTTILLFKAISLGACDSDLQSSLEILEACISALNSTAVKDEFDFSSHFAALIETRIAVFKTTFVRPPDVESRMTRLQTIRGDPLEGVPGVATTLQNSAGIHESGVTAPVNTHPSDLIFDDISDWWTRPFDPSLAPFSAWDDHISSNLEIDSLDFLWNIPMD
ncbi:C6 transcription factor [Exophiala viscosa]|uniref:C6 transcription factor n=1 Tax=Exophiala viscosa TaxID=2486360 RepID=UPI002196ED29|nr:C6 transcription factor [Exophiala viscosa]